MSAAPSEPRHVPVEVLPPIPGSAAASPVKVEEPRAPFEGLKTFYHPASGVVILGLDWLIFGTDLFTDFLAIPVMCVLGFLLSFALLVAIQTKWAKNELPAALGKAFLGAFLVAVPFPITGTLLGAAVLALSGLPHHPVDMVKRLAGSRSEK
jgi:cytochrome bd-type quinol oxidase subunit 1